MTVEDGELFASNLMFGIKSTRVLIPAPGDGLRFAYRVVVINSKTGNIEMVIEPFSAPRGLQVFDAGHNVVMPGIIDMNASLTWACGTEVRAL